MYTHMYIHMHHAPELAQVKFHGTMPLEIHWKLPVTIYCGDHTDPPHPHPRHLLDIALTLIYTIIQIYYTGGGGGGVGLCGPYTGKGTLRLENTLRSEITLEHLYYTILYCTILYYTILYCTVLYYTILYYTILYYYISTESPPETATGNPRRLPRCRFLVCNSLPLIPGADFWCRFLVSTSEVPISGVQ